MAANFYDNAGVMAGCDIHKFWAPGPPPTLLTPVPIFGHIVAAPFLWPPATFWKRTGTVKSDNWQMIQGGFDLYLVPHIPWPAPQGWYEPLELIMVHMNAGSKAQLTVHSVTGMGNPLATCIVSAVGLNVNCQEAGLSAPTGAVVNINSVETSPTAGDYAGAVVGWAVDAALGWAMDSLPDWAKHGWRRIGDVPYLKVLDVPSHVQNFVQRWVDSSFSEAVDGFTGDVKGVFGGSGT
ncbi:MAG: hypothetical protein IPM54_39660 [Polyangiaceae bacterium]|nr:hypothetical protein [Polyangiaceae bacterium]